MCEPLSFAYDVVEQIRIAIDSDRSDAITPTLECFLIPGNLTPMSEEALEVCVIYFRFFDTGSNTAKDN
jgi:hypothetical protein